MQPQVGVGGRRGRRAQVDLDGDRLEVDRRGGRRGRRRPRARRGRAPGRGRPGNAPSRGAGNQVSSDGAVGGDGGEAVAPGVRGRSRWRRTSWPRAYRRPPSEARRRRCRRPKLARMAALDLSVSLVDLTRQLCDIESVSGDETAVADAIWADARAAATTSSCSATATRSSRGRTSAATQRVVIAGHIDTVPDQRQRARPATRRAMASTTSGAAAPST